MAKKGTGDELKTLPGEDNNKKADLLPLAEEPILEEEAKEEPPLAGFGTNVVESGFEKKQEEAVKPAFGAAKSASMADAQKIFNKTQEVSRAMGAATKKKFGVLPSLTFLFKEEHIMEFLRENLGGISSPWNLGGAPIVVSDVVTTLSEKGHDEKTIFAWLQAVTGLSAEEIVASNNSRATMVVPVCTLKKRDFTTETSGNNSMLGGLKKVQTLDVSQLVKDYPVFDVGPNVTPINTKADDFNMYMNILTIVLKMIESWDLGVSIGSGHNQYSISLLRNASGYVVTLGLNRMQVVTKK